MSTILMSIKPKYVDMIFNGYKTYEYRKKPCKKDIDKIIVYSSSPVKKIIGELLIDEVLYDEKDIIWNKTHLTGGINRKEFDEYFGNQDKALAYKIKKYIKYDEYKTLKDYNILYSPQSYVYIDKE